MRVRHRLLLTMAVIVGLAAVGRAQQHTKNLGLLLGGQQYENQNWQRLDQAVCQRPGDPTLCVRGGPANILQGATAPFACAATTSGLYTDTDCNQICRCNPGQAKWCRSDTGACLSATDCCAPPTTTTTSTTTTTVTTTTTTTTTTTSTTSTTLIVPTGGAADVNCPATIPTTNTCQTTILNTLEVSITCATPAVTTHVLSISFYAGIGAAGAHQKCSVYTFPPGYVSGTTSVPKVAPGCDTVEWTAPGPTMNAYVTLPVTGSCPLAPSTRYMIGCNQDNGYFNVCNSTSCSVGGVACQQERDGQSYTTALPDPWTANSTGAVSFAYYLTVGP